DVLLPGLALSVWERAIRLAGRVAEDAGLEPAVARRTADSIVAAESPPTEQPPPAVAPAKTKPPVRRQPVKKQSAKKTATRKKTAATRRAPARPARRSRP
ncbi:MAG: hypothetical protein ACRDJM_01670, partial [Actinomycetota bacterium]